MSKNLQRRIKQARFMGQQHRFRHKSLETNPFARYEGIDGDGELILQAFIEGWQECDKELAKQHAKER